MGSLESKRGLSSLAATLTALGLVIGCGIVGCGGDDDSTPATNTTGADAGTDTGTGTGQACAAPSTMCGSACVDTQNDRTNCGGCGTACAPGEVCAAGTCGLECAGGATKCGEACVDAMLDPANCGGCGKACADGEVCSKGACGLTCDAAQKKCGGTGGVRAFCAEVQTDSNNCGDCGVPCTGAQKCVAGKCELGCATSADCGGGAAKCGAGGVCVVPQDCSDLLASTPSAPSGKYMIDPDGAAGAAPFEAYCDMTTDGGGWTIVNAQSGADNEQPFTSDAAATGDAVAFQNFNLTRAQKMALSALETESIFVRKDGRWLKADKPMFDNTLGNANSSASVAVKLNGMNGAIADGFMGWSNFNIDGGGDFGIAMAPDGTTCGGTTTNGFDNHSTNYHQLNCGCESMYLYSYSANNADGDGAYNARFGLGGWTPTAGCSSSEGLGLAIYAGMRRHIATPAASCAAIKAANAGAPSGMYAIDVDGAAGPNPTVMAYCDMTTDGGGYTFVTVDGGISTTRYDEANSCQQFGMDMAIPRTLGHVTVMRTHFPAIYMRAIPGVYGDLAANYGTGGQNCAMNSGDATCAAHWFAIDGKDWFLRDVPFGEPNGNYTPGCWLNGLWASYLDEHGSYFDDNNCNHATGGQYLCSDNAK